MRNLVYKFKYAFLQTFRLRLKAIFSQFFALIGASFTIAEILYDVFDSAYGFDLIRSRWALICALFIVVCVAINWRPLKYTCFLKNADTKITLMVGDILKQKGALVVPTNTTFDTTMEDEFISVRSVQGQYQEKYYHNNLTALNQKLTHALDGTQYKRLTDRSNTNSKRYEIGTTCKISEGLKHTYFLAVADINKYGKPENVTSENILIALGRFWQKLNEIGHLETISMPIIGTGCAGIKNTSRDQVIQDIIWSFVITAREMKVTENLVICICPKDFACKNIHWDDLCEYLQYICKYQYSRKNASAEGVPEAIAP